MTLSNQDIQKLEREAIDCWEMDEDKVIPYSVAISLKRIADCLEKLAAPEQSPNANRTS